MLHGLTFDRGKNIEFSFNSEYIFEYKRIFMAYYWFKAFHLIGVVVWFAGLFYLVRLFVYHAEANQEPEPAQSILKKQYEMLWANQ